MSPDTAIHAFDPDIEISNFIRPDQPTTLQQKLQPFTRKKSWPKTVLRIIAIITVPFFIAQSVAFVSFIHEESLQATAFGCNAALAGQDPTIAYAAVKTFEQQMINAKEWQDKWGKLAFWADDAYHSYFYRAAPIQLLGFYSRGRALGLWEDDVNRWIYHKETQRFVDSWQLMPRDRLLLQGFDPELVPYMANRKD